ncbi:LacI family DNA-binding transcriptional regulator [Asticcacaulis sp. 201]|uniref:LacI family DNA-binding transcriptional regulator n=1 Tax=Asticcacaulis sp. 201 TaxID=3028787 RepID=UPI002915EA16|nr:LacI family DNA-binding transcriptional regulator [Asticcacaulis sp. 201]MDV6331715.1 LacI family DNA-binding transcriptional regulator [Asticcacaulis sp. 201]
MAKLSFPAQTSREPAAKDAVEDFLKRRKKATINDVAHLAQVSKKTVSRVINNSPSVREETRDAVNDIIARVGFRPDPQARGLAFRRSFLLGLVYDNPNAQYIVNMQMGALDGLRGSGTELVVHPCDWRSANFLEDIRNFVESQRLAGVIILPPIAEDRDLLALMDQLDIPYIRITARSGEDASPPIHAQQIVSRDREGCRQAGAHVGELGHTRIGYVSGNLAYPSAHERRAGFDAGLAEHGVKIAPDLEVPGDYSFESGYAGARTLLSHANPPTALICANDEMAAAAYRAAFEKGLRIPEDLTIIGFDDAPIATRIYPPLTTVRLPTRDMARIAAETLIQTEGTVKPTVIIDAALVVRGSSGPASR